jgi:hypothetical protein
VKAMATIRKTLALSDITREVKGIDKIEVRSEKLLGNLAEQEGIGKAMVAGRDM